MKIAFNRDTPIASLGMTPFYRLGPERWFNEFTIISYLPWDGPAVDNLNTYSIRDINPSVVLKPENTQSMVRTDEFMQILEEKGLREHNFITYRPVDLGFATSKGEDSKRFTKTYENKRWIRDKYGKTLPFPEYRTLSMGDMLGAQVDYYTDLTASLGSDKLVLQHERLTGGRGTWIVEDGDGFSKALVKLSGNSKIKNRDSIVVSKAVPGAKEVSFQACITKYGVFVGPPQSQFVRDPLLVGVDSESADQFCGGMISDELVNSEALAGCRKIIAQIAHDMQKDGYVGIFGVDFLLDDKSNLYVLEVNARMTGMLPLLTRLQSDYPFLLLHILETIGADYSLPNDVDLTSPEPISGGAYVLAHAGTDGVSGGDRMTSGNYSADGLVSRDIYPSIGNYSLHNYIAEGQKIDVGQRLGAVFSCEVDLESELGGISRKFIKKYLDSMGQ